MRAILIVFVTISAILGVVLMVLAVRGGGFEQAGQVIDRQVEDASLGAKRAAEQAGDAIERATDTAN